MTYIFIDKLLYRYMLRACVEERGEWEWSKKYRLELNVMTIDACDRKEKWYLGTYLVGLLWKNERKKKRTRDSVQEWNCQSLSKVSLSISWRRQEEKRWANTGYGKHCKMKRKRKRDVTVYLMWQREEARMRHIEKDWEREKRKKEYNVNWKSRLGR